MKQLSHIKQLANEVNGDTPMSLFISSFDSDDDKFVVCVICAWLSNGYDNETYMARHIVDDIMQGKPSEYVRKYSCLDNIVKTSDKNASFFCLLTYKNFDNLCLSLRRIFECGGISFVQDTLNKKRRRRMYAHNLLIGMFGDGVGFPTSKSNGTFYRLNLLLYWLTYKTHIIHCSPTLLLLPCNDRVLERACEMRVVVNKKLRHNLKNAEHLTNVARSMFAGDEFYKLYEFLAS